jgi:uncharacterized protein (DUF2336 family)
MMNLTHMDVRKLTQEPSAKVRGMLATKLALDYRSGNFTDAEAEIADDIFRILLKDAEKKVRKTLSEQLCHCPHVPHDIIMRLARDEASVAVPVLEFSYVLTEEDLIAIVKSARDAAKLCAVARRDNISENLSGTLVEARNEQAMHTLLRNKGASISEATLNESWQIVASSPSLLETLVERGNLPLTIAEKIFFVASEETKRRLSREYKLSAPLIHKAAGDAREWEMLGIVPADITKDPNNDEQVEDLVDQLHLTGRLTHSFLIRALCTGNVNVFEAGMARLSGVPRVNARILLMDNGALGFHALYKTAGMPEGFANAVQTLLRISLEETDFGLMKRGDFRKRIVDRIYMEGAHRTVENMEYLLSIIGGRVATTSSVH